MYAHHFKSHMETHDPIVSYLCLICHKSIKVKNSLRRHIKNHEIAALYKKEPTLIPDAPKCKICGKTFNTHAYLNLHLELHDPTSQHSCELCDKVYQMKDSLRRHISTVHKKNSTQVMTITKESPQCKLCGKTFKNNSTLNVHVETHNPKCKYTCDICGKAFRVKDSLRRHLTTHNVYAKKPEFILGNHVLTFKINNCDVFHCKQVDGGDVFMCKSCEHIYVSMDALKAHMHSEVHAVDPFAFHCLMCNKFYPTKQHLAYHIKRMHFQQHKLTCHICGMQLKTRGNLKKHMYVHTGEKPFKCDTCDYRCSQKGSLKVHMRIHEAVRFVVSMCAVCGKSFTHNSTYLQHTRTAHSNERPYACTQCDKTFKTNNLLRRHVAIHSDVRTHICRFCGKQFLRRSNLSVHVKIHTGERPHTCSICGKGFLQKHVRDSHMQTHDLNMT